MIISLFGPDGSGKSLIADRLGETYHPVFSGTSVASWPDQSWHNQLVQDGIDDATYRNTAHFEEKIERAHAMAATIHGAHGVVVIDSDPFHKTYMHDIVRTGPDSARFAYLWSLIGGKPGDERVHLHIKVSRSLTHFQQAEILQERIGYRSEFSIFDPTEIKTSLKMIEACDAIHAQLESIGQRVITVYTDEPFDPAGIVAPIQFDETEL